MQETIYTILTFISAFFLGYYYRIFEGIFKKIWGNAIIAHDKKSNLPEFVSMGKTKKNRGTEMRLRYDSYFGEPILEYWRDAGIWSIGFRWEQRGLKRVLISDASNYSDDMKKRLDGVILVPITKKEWEKGNEGYVPTDGSVEFELKHPEEFETNEDEIAF